MYPLRPAGAPPEGASNGKRLLLLKASSKKGRFFRLPYSKVSLYLRAYTWLSPRESWRDARKGGETERGGGGLREAVFFVKSILPK